MTEPGATRRIRDYYDRNASRYDRLSQDGGPLIQDGRRWLASEARGRTLEVGIGTGLTLPFYDFDSAGFELVGVELSPRMAAIAGERARVLRVPATIVVGDAMALPFDDAAFDTVAFCGSLCTIPDDRAALSEAVRVLRPGGRLIALEHVRSPHLPVRLAERLIEPISGRSSGDHLLRDPLDHLAALGLDLERLERRRLGIMERLVARKSG